MSKKLVIVESPTKCKTIGHYLGQEYLVKATMGHVSDLPERELGVDLENDFLPQYVAPEEKAKLIAELQKEAEEADIIYLAPDPDREGEAIAWHVAQVLNVSPEKILRIQFNEITQSAVRDAIRKPSAIDMNMVNAQQARRVLDRIVGYKISPILWKTLYKGLSAGRVQSVALRIICEREREIRKFKTEEYWTVTANMCYNGLYFPSKLIAINGKNAELTNEADATAIEISLWSKPFLISDVVKSDKIRKPYAPFITSTLQQNASRSLGFTAAKTMMIAQQLYEGIDLGEIGTVGLITYMRTDSPRVSEEALTSVRELIGRFFDQRHLHNEPRYYGKSKNSQDAHEAIRPANIKTEYAPSVIQGFLSKDQLQLYELIWKRFISSQMSDAIIEETRIDFSAADTIFSSTGSVITFDGFLALYEESGEKVSNDLSECGLVPVTAVGSLINPPEISKKQNFTQPPARFSEAMLVRELEKKGIGRPSTYALIIDTLKKRKYVEIEKKRFIPTEIAFNVIDILVEQFTDILEVDFTADMERKLDLVEEGSEDWINLLRSFYRPFENQLTAVTSRLKEIKSEHQEISEKCCPHCGEHNLVVKWSRNGKFLACPGFPKCRHTESLEPEQEEATDLICEKCGAHMSKITRNENSFLGCSNYPNCDNTISVGTGVKCPVDSCEGELIERRTKRGKLFYGCSSYPNCEFATWDKPLQEQCLACGYNMLIEKNTKAKGHYKMCPGCKKEFEINDTD